MDNFQYSSIIVNFATMDNYRGLGPKLNGMIGYDGLETQIDRQMQASRPLVQQLGEGNWLRRKTAPSVSLAEDIHRIRDTVSPNVKFMEEIERNRQDMFPLAYALENVQRFQENSRLASVFTEIQAMRENTERLYQTSPLFVEIQMTNEAMQSMYRKLEVMPPSEHVSNILKNTDLLQSIYYKVNSLKGSGEMYGGVRALEQERAHRKMTVDSSVAGGPKVLTGSHLFKQGYWEIDYDLSIVTDRRGELGSIITPPYIIKEAKDIKRIIAEVYKSNAKLFSVTSRQFEELICELLARRGFRVELTKQTRDGGRDIIAVSYDNIQSELKYLIECKRWAKSRKVGIDVIRSFCYTINKEKANKGMIFTTSSFTRDARKERTTFGSHFLELRDYDQIIQWVTDYIIGFSGQPV